MAGWKKYFSNSSKKLRRKEFRRHGVCAGWGAVGLGTGVLAGPQQRASPCDGYWTTVKDGLRFNVSPIRSADLGTAGTVSGSAHLKRPGHPTKPAELTADHIEMYLR